MLAVLNADLAGRNLRFGAKLFIGQTLFRSERQLNADQSWRLQFIYLGIAPQLPNNVSYQMEDFF